MILDMYITMFPVIIGGVLNMIFCHTNFYRRHNKPIDNGKTLRDGKRIFGDNKTIIGFISMIVICMITQVLYGFLCNALHIQYRNELYDNNYNSVYFNLMLGFLFGFAYMLFELPNSFIKRRIDIEAGKTKKNLIGYLFFVVDQIDSLFGVILVLYLFSNISIAKYFGYVALGGLTHIIVNLILYKLKIRRNL